MLGLITKDINLLFKRKQVLVIFLIVCAVMSFSTDGSFIVGYMAFLGMIFSLSTIAYDEYGNGLQFILTLPITRKDYALSKYAGSFLIGLVSWGLGVVIMFITNMMRGVSVNMVEDIGGSLMVFAIVIMMMDITIPFNLKYGSEKGRIIMLVVAGAIAAFSAVVFRVPGLADKLDLFIDTLTTTSLMNTALVLIVMVLVVSYISSVISIKIMENKEL